MSIGKIVRWQDDKGFGFVKSDDLDKDVFVHISAFPANSPRPKVGDEVVFQVKDTPKGLQVDKIRFQTNQTTNFSNNPHSSNIKLELKQDHSLPNTNEKKYKQPIEYHQNNYRQNNVRKNHKSKGWVSSLFSILMLGGIGYYGYNELSQRFSNSQNESAINVREISSDNVTRIAQPTTSQNFTCDGRKTCGQMTSREEAQWFSKNCPDTKMDGDGDGDVCENDSRW